MAEGQREHSGRTEEIKSQKQEYTEYVQKVEWSQSRAEIGTYWG